MDVVSAKDLENAKPKIKEGDIVLMNTGWHHYWRVDDYVYYNYYPECTRKLASGY